MENWENKKITFHIVIALICLVFINKGYAIDLNSYNKLKIYSNKIISQLSSDWKIIEEKKDVIPFGHYVEPNSQVNLGIEFKVISNKDVFLHWEDKKYVLNKTALAKESLQIWIMPKKYHQSWKRFFIMKKPIPAREIYSNSMIQVYAYTSHYIASKEKFYNLPWTSTAWPDSPHQTGELSWTNWENDIVNILKNKK